MEHWINQNHDRLAQKAGYPQHALNEIHGAWGDVKNRVLQMDESLRDDLYHWMERWAEKTDCVLALGSSLCGMNADQIVSAGVRANGLIICSIQRTPYEQLRLLAFKNSHFIV